MSSLNEEERTSTVLVTLYRDQDVASLQKQLPDGFELADPASYDPEQIDLCIIDTVSWEAGHEELQSIRKRQHPVHVPVMLMGKAETLGRLSMDILGDADQLLPIPISTQMLLARLKNMRQNRLQSVRLAEQKDHLRRFRKAMDESDSGITLTDYQKPDNPIVYANDTFCSMTGYDRDEILGHNCRFLQGEDTDQQAIDQLKESIQNEDACQATIRNYTKAGRMFWNRLNIAPIYNEDGELSRWIGVQNDVTELKQLEKEKDELLDKERTLRAEAEESRAVFRDMFEHAPTAVALGTGPDHRCKYANQAYKTIVDRHDLEGKTFDEALPELVDQGYLELLDHIYETGEIYQAEEEPIQLKRQDGSMTTRYINLELKPLFDDEGTSYGILAVVVDVTKQVTYRSELQERLEEKTTLLAEIHHRVKNNLAVISGLLDMQKDQTDNQTARIQLSDAFGRIQSIALVHELLYQEAESGAHIKLQTYLPKLVDTIQRVASTDEKHITTSVDAEKANIPLDQAVSTGLLITELVTNTFKHAFQDHSGGQVKVTAETQEWQLQVKISDDGTGLPEDFSMEESSGMGMQIVGTLLEQLSADITYDSSPGEGTTFKVHIPLETEY